MPNPVGDVGAIGAIGAVGIVGAVGTVGRPFEFCGYTATVLFILLVIAIRCL